VDEHVVGDRAYPAIKLRAGWKLAVEQQVRDLEEGALRRQLLDRISPASPSRNVIALRQEAVFIKAGSYVISPKSASSALIWRKSVARMVPSVIGSSYD
jgi:hypothetical protein